MFVTKIVSTCFNKPDKPTCIDLVLTNGSNLFQDSNAFATGLSDFNLLTVLYPTYNCLPQLKEFCKKVDFFLF